MELINYDLIVLNSSGGKDSLAMIFEVIEMAKKQNYPLHRIIVSHQDLGESEWKGTKELVKKQADLFGLKLYVEKRVNKHGQNESLL